MGNTQLFILEYEAVLRFCSFLLLLFLLLLVEKLWPNRAQGLPVQTPGEALILASIVEKETGVGAERAHVASWVMSNTLPATG